MVDAMEMDANAQIIVAVALGVLTIVWNQQRSVGNLRQEFQEANKELRRELQEAHSQMRQEFQKAHSQMRHEFQEANAQLRGAVARNGERLARIEGHLGIGVDAPRAPRTSGTRAHTDEAAQTRHAATG